ncbi:MAG: SMI1/KNR4 family protein [Pirellulales bacterium]
MTLSFQRRGPAIANADINAFEVRIGRTLPTDYRRFLLVYNGGVPEHHVLRESTTGDVGVQLFYGIWDDGAFNIDMEQQLMRGRWPERFMSIAIDDCGNAFCISLGPPDYGSVYFWDHEREAPEGEGPTEDNLYLLGNSFTEFWNRLEPIDRDTYLAEQGTLDLLDEESAGPDAPHSGSNGEPN